MKKIINALLNSRESSVVEVGSVPTPWIFSVLAHQSHTYPTPLSWQGPKVSIFLWSDETVNGNTNLEPRGNVRGRAALKTVNIQQSKRMSGNLM